MQPETVRPLVCAECGRHDSGDEPGWTLRLDVDDELVAFCPECDREEFAGPETAEPITGRSGGKPMEEVPNRAEPGEFNHNDCADERLRRKTDAGAARVSSSGSRDGLTASSVISYSSPSLP